MLTRKERIAVYQATMAITAKGSYPSSRGGVITIDETDEMMKGTILYREKAVVDYDSLPKYDTEVKVVDNDCLYAAKELVDRGLNPAVLNMASYQGPGGFVIGGSSAQEESIFRRSNLFKSLYQFDKELGGTYGVNVREQGYPLKLNFGGIYSPKVTVFRASEYDNCDLLEIPFKVGVISVAAIKRPNLEDGKMPTWAIDVTKNKIEQILDIALANGHDSVVLSAFGCGAYKTPPEDMAKIFKDVLSDEKYHRAFKAIHFAIINVESLNGQHNPKGNFKPFYDVLNK